MFYRVTTMEWIIPYSHSLITLSCVISWQFSIRFNNTIDLYSPNYFTSLTVPWALRLYSSALWLISALIFKWREARLRGPISALSAYRAIFKWSVYLLSAWVFFFIDYIVSIGFNFLYPSFYYTFCGILWKYVFINMLKHWNASLDLCVFLESWEIIKMNIRFNDFGYLMDNLVWCL